MTAALLFKKLQRRLAQTTIGASPMRGQGKGAVKKCRDYCEKRIRVTGFFGSLQDEKKFMNYLDRHTRKLSDELPRVHGQPNFGAARKALNLFFRELVYNKYFADAYGLSASLRNNHKEIKWLEIPLDSHVAGEIKKRYKKIPVRWKSIKGLTRQENKIYQDHAQRIAIKEKVARIHLDMKFWRRD